MTAETQPVQCPDCEAFFTPYTAGQKRCFLCDHRPPQMVQK